MTPKPCLKDGIGSVTGISNADETITDSYTYDAYGNTLSHSGTTDQPYQYVGGLGYYQDDSGLQLLTNRYYDPNSGRFTAVDPIGYNGGYNLYAYVNGNPVDWVDPMGMKGDWAGEALINHYKTGKGEKLVIRDTKWNDYLMKEKGLVWQTRLALANRLAASDANDIKCI